MRESFSDRAQLGIEVTLQELDSLRSRKEVNNPRVQKSLDILWRLGIKVVALRPDVKEFNGLLWREDRINGNPYYKDTVERQLLANLDAFYKNEVLV